ncbi:LysR family transcriptional regulator [Ruegeria sp. Ofav3-42]|uniref:LysR family transcriptional regulator n=1 Tax=Ruegeria sp. Ofav3-42 TaxID=2917759 RepID=UPI001EF44EA8|nr:LysR family transcriptional regulator [Ruegeria sp. Ofav3-42]MCG7518622.1 LysR family transcriptional regulator [Ruegeria sp. Ofav3-42]
MLYISLRQYEYVCAIGRFGSLSAAAQQLNVSQPALSTALTRVESHIGYPLFTRKRGASMALTPQGRSFIEDAETLLAGAARLEKADQIHATKAQLRLGCFVDLAPFFLASAVRKLRTALPDLALTYKVDGFEGLISGLIDGQIDLALTYGLSMDAAFQQTTLFTSLPNAIMAPHHPLAGASSVSLDELATHPLILSNEGLSAQHVLGLFRQIGLRPSVAHRAASLEIQRSLAAHQEGIAISYANPPSTYSYDGMPLVSLPVSDRIAAEPVVLARHGTGPADPNTAVAERILTELLG